MMAFGPSGEIGRARRRVRADATRRRSSKPPEGSPLAGPGGQAVSGPGGQAEAGPPQDASSRLLSPSSVTASWHSRTGWLACLLGHLTAWLPVCSAS